MSHQPVVRDEHGVLRFKRNEIVHDLLDGLLKQDLNVIAALVARGRYSQEDYSQLMQLVGYSLDGYCDLSLVPQDDKNQADRILAEMERAL